MRLTLLLIITTLLPFAGIAQPKLYYPDSSIKVIAYGNEQTLAWCGGFNTPQFAMGDLNHDGLQDLVAFEPWVGVTTYINRGTAGNSDFRYTPEYALNFPPIFNYLILGDYNCDNIPDLFQRGGFGIAVYKGYYNAQNQLCFTFYRDIYYFNDIDTHGPANAYVNPGDIPSVTDVDGDGDLDFVSYNISGGFMYYYKNLRVEDGLPCDSIRVRLHDKCWGKVYQGFYREHTLGQTCDNSSLQRDGSRVTHTGNTPCLFDYDMDGDMDYLDGSVSFNEMTFLRNGRISSASAGADSMVAQDTMWQTGGKRIDIPIWPSAHHIDVDQDGRKDLLIAPNGGGSSKNYNNVWYYKNFTSPGSPDWRFQSDSFLGSKAIELGTGAYPTLYDFDRDGKLDLFVGSDGYSQTSGVLRSRLSYYRNTSTPGAPSFTLQNADFNGLNSNNFKGIAPAIGDIDNDGIDDLVVGHTDGTMSYLKNMAASNLVPPVWQMLQLQLTDNAMTVITTMGHAAPLIYDIDKDGKKDLVIGSDDGYLQYYRNVSTITGAISLQLVNYQLGHAKVDPIRNVGLNSAPFIGVIDSTGTEYLLMGSNSGNIYKFTGFQSGDTTATYTMLDSQYAYIDSAGNAYAHLNTTGFQGLYDNMRSAPVVGDINGDGNFFMFVGDINGGVKLYRYGSHPASTPAIVRDDRLNVYPNPASSILNIAWPDAAPADATMSIVNMAGQQLYTTSLSSASRHATLSIGDLPVGMYVCVLQSGGERWYSKFAVVR